MELKGIDAKLFTMVQGSYSNDKGMMFYMNPAMKLVKKYPGNFASGFAAAYDDSLHRVHQAYAGKISVEAFPDPIYGEFDGELCSPFLHLLKCYEKEKSLDKLPWSYPEIKNKLRACVQTVEENRFVKCLVRLLKSLAIAAISAGVYYGIYKLLPHLEKASGLEFFAGLVLLVAGISCLAFSLWSVILLLGGLGPSKSQRQDLAKAYVDAMRYIRYRILWFQDTYNEMLRRRTGEVPPYLAEAEKELLNEVNSVKDVLRRELGEDWLVPVETICVEDVDKLMEEMEMYEMLICLTNKEYIVERSHEINEMFGRET